MIDDNAGFYQSAVDRVIDSDNQGSPAMAVIMDDNDHGPVSGDIHVRASAKP